MKPVCHIVSRNGGERMKDASRAAIMWKELGI